MQDTRLGDSEGQLEFLDEEEVKYGNKKHNGGTKATVYVSDATRMKLTGSKKKAVNYKDLNISRGDFEGMLVVYCL